MLTSSYLLARISCWSARCSACSHPRVSLAGGPAKVTVRVEGLDRNQAPTDVRHDYHDTSRQGRQPRRTPAPVPARSARSQLATSGNWTGRGKRNSTNTRSTRSRVRRTKSKQARMPNYYWSFWLNDKEASVGACDVRTRGRRSGAVLSRLLRRGLSDARTDSACDRGSRPPPTQANKSNVTVKQYNSKGEAAPAVGANVGRWRHKRCDRLARSCDPEVRR